MELPQRMTTKTHLNVLVIIFTTHSVTVKLLAMGFPTENAHAPLLTGATRNGSQGNPGFLGIRNILMIINKSIFIDKILQLSILGPI